MAVTKGSVCNLDVEPKSVVDGNVVVVQRSEMTAVAMAMAMVAELQRYGVAVLQ